MSNSSTAMSLNSSRSTTSSLRNRADSPRVSFPAFSGRHPALQDILFGTDDDEDNQAISNLTQSKSFLDDVVVGVAHSHVMDPILQAQSSTLPGTAHQSTVETPAVERDTNVEDDSVYDDVEAVLFQAPGDVHMDSGLPAMTRSQPTPGYPSPDAVLRDEQTAALLASSGLIHHLSAIPHTEVMSLGTQHLKNVDLELISVTPYFQVILKMTSVYYEKLPSIGYSTKVMALLHYYRMVSARIPISQVSEEIKIWYTTCSSMGLDEVATLTARMFIKASWLQSSDLCNSVPYLALCAGIDTGNMISPLFERMYTMFGHLLEGGSRCIEPIPDFLEFNDAFSLYINSIATGVRSYEDLHVIMISRAIDMPRAAYQSKKSSVDKAKEDECESSNRQRPQPNVRVFLPPSYVRNRANNLDRENVVTDSPQVSASAPAMPATHREPVISIETLRQSVPLQQRTNRQDSDNSLIHQGDPGRTQEVRDTTSFREGIQSFQGVLERLEVIEQKVDRVFIQNEAITKLVTDLGEHVKKLDRTLGIVITQTGAAGLHTRESVNQSIFTQDEGPAAEVIRRATPAEPVSPAVIDPLEMRLLNFQASHPGNALLAAELKAYLTSKNQIGMANSITANALEVGISRARIIQRLRTLARGP